MCKQCEGGGAVRETSYGSRDYRSAGAPSPCSCGVRTSTATLALVGRAKERADKSDRDEAVPRANIAATAALGAVVVAVLLVGAALVTRWPL